MTTTTTTTTSGAADLLATVSNALREAYNLGMMYWQQADSEYISQHKKADDTRAKFLALVEETCAALAAGQATAAQPAPVLWVSPEQFANFMDADEAQFGRYVPARKTSAGNFTMPLFAAPAQPAAQQGAAYAALPEPDIAVGNDGRARIYTCKDIVGEPYYTAGQLRDFADATHALRASHGQAPAGAAEEIDKALNVYAQAFAARVNGWTRQNGDDLPGARSALFAAIHAYAQASTRPTTSPQADNKKKEPQ